VLSDEEGGKHIERKYARPRCIGETVEQLQVAAWHRPLAEHQETSRYGADSGSKTAPVTLASRDIV